MHVCKKSFLLLFIFFLSFPSFAQFAEIDVKSYINKDSILLGEPFMYTLSIIYPPKYEIAIPDSHDIPPPLEWIGKTYFNTVCKDSLCKDSIQYFLRTFNADSILIPNIPVYIFSENRHDTLFIHPALKEIVIKKLRPSGTDFTWQEDASYLEIRPSVNYWYYGVVALIVLIVATVLLLLVGPIILRRIKLFNLSLNHQRYVKDFDEQILEFTTHQQATDLEKCITIWKSYLTRLESKPYTTLTTTELKDLQDMEDVIIPLTNLDRFLYGGLRQTETIESLNALRRFSNRRFLKKKKEVRDVR
ncbi:MAG TPA: hypothetical protein VK750_07540 [Cytophagaceae bacterium]|jgi:hypothetical protein|nr:hypothetical protein [Cytophagaceae bacterium]